jgi:hypothetical protein
VITLRDGRTLSVDVTEAHRLGRVVELIVGRNVVVNGEMRGGVLHARVVNRAKGKGGWGKDSPR